MIACFPFDIQYNENENAKVFVDEERYSGWLDKETENKKGFNKRYFVLTKYGLLWFKDEKVNNPK